MRSVLLQFSATASFERTFVDIQSLLSELKTERNRMDQAISALEVLASPSAPRRGRPPKAKPSTPASGKKRRGMNAAARRRISEAMKKRWATWHGKSAPQRKPMSPARSEASFGADEKALGTTEKVESGLTILGPRDA